MRRLLSLCLGVLAGALVCSGCRTTSGKDEEVEKAPRPRPLVLAPLTTRPLPAASDYRARAPEGARGPKPVLVELAASARDCAVEALPPLEAFVLCVWTPSSYEEGVRRSLRELKSVYLEYVAPPPVILVLGPERLREGLELVLPEPSFFAKLLVREGAEGGVLFNATFLQTFAERGGRRVAWLGEGAPEDKGARLTAASKSLPSGWRTFSAGELARAVDFLLAPDPAPGSSPAHPGSGSSPP